MSLKVIKDAYIESLSESLSRFNKITFESNSESGFSLTGFTMICGKTLVRLAEMTDTTCVVDDESDVITLRITKNESIFDNLPPIPEKSPVDAHNIFGGILKKTEGAFVETYVVCPNTSVTTTKLQAFSKNNALVQIIVRAKSITLTVAKRNLSKGSLWQCLHKQTKHRPRLSGFRNIHQKARLTKARKKKRWKSFL